MVLTDKDFSLDGISGTGLGANLLNDYVELDTGFQINCEGVLNNSAWLLLFIRPLVDTVGFIELMVGLYQIKLVYMLFYYKHEVSGF